MRPILLLGPDLADPALSAFGEYLTNCGVPHVACSDLTRIKFAYTIGRNGYTNVRLDVPGLGSFADDEIAVLVRKAWAFPGRAGTDSAERFAAREYYSSWWTLCASLPYVVNRPGRWAWLTEREAWHRLATSVLPEYWTSAPGELPGRWAMAGSAETHVEDLVGFTGRVFSRRDDLSAWAASRPAPHVRAIFAPSSRYLLQICVGGVPIAVRNETDIDVCTPKHQSRMRNILQRLEVLGLEFFGVAMVAGEDGVPYVTRIVSDPPYLWYRSCAEEIHQLLCARLQQSMIA